MSPRRMAIGSVVMIASVMPVGAGAIDSKTHPPSPRHKVQRGQTLYSIARTYGVPLAGLAAANGISNPSILQAGVTLVIPTVEPRGAARPDAPAPGRPTRARARRPASGRAAGRSVPTPSRDAPGGPLAQVVPPALSPSMSPALPDLSSLPAGLPWPLTGPVLSGFDHPRRGHRHGGIDIGSHAGAPVRAVASGIVTLSEERYGEYGRLVAIEHDNGMVSYYGHNSKNLVKRGQKVSAEQVIALVGESGNATRPHLHFELRLRGQRIDPRAALTDAVTEDR